MAYDDGIRVVDFSDPSDPHEIASFIAPGAPDVGFFWGVYFHRGLILGSDIFSGLYILASGDDDDDDDDDSDSD